MRLRLLSFIGACLVAGWSSCLAQTFDKPFSADSSWKSPVNPKSGFSSLNLTSYPVGLSSWLRPDGSSIPVYDATASKTTNNVLYNPYTWMMLAAGLWKHSGNSSTTEAQIRSYSASKFPYPFQVFASQSPSGLVLPSTYNHIPSSPGAVFTPGIVLPSLDPDGHLAIFQPDGRVFESYGTIVLSNGDLVCLSYNLTDTKSDGSGAQNGVTASMLPVYAGVVRKAEYASQQIAHAIKIVVPPKLLKAAFVSPALAFDRGAMTETPAYSGTLPMGARLAIPPTVALKSLGLATPLGRTLAAAAQTYGFIITDRGGSGITILVERNTGIPDLETWDAGAASDLQKIFSKLAWAH